MDNMDLNSDTVFASLAQRLPAVRLTLPPASFFSFPPSSEPRTIPPPPDHPTLAHPFTIPTDIYNALLSPFVPAGIALVYITTIAYLNRLNASRQYRPWAFSKTRFFHLLVIIHNILLAVYSAWTFVGMCNALRVSVVAPWGEWGLAGTVDSFCKMQGPRGMGSAAVYNPQTSTWGIANRFFHLGADGLAPEVTDIGRIWNEGLAFYGWLFYLSKFYEVIDTLIILAKGKKSSFLQTYHHAGAMLCMWAGIRYMSPPIWMFALVNSFVHSIMYTFYLCSALQIKVPLWFKRSLTTVQIAQFVVGASYAFLHLVVKYQSPYSIQYAHQFSDAATAVVSDVSSVASSVATSAATADLMAYLKKAALRAAGREGLAENILNRQGQTFGVDAQHPARELVPKTETRYREDLQWTHCLDTSGQTFAIYLNVLYLVPLCMLFIRFFVKSYMQRLERRRSSTASQKAHLAVRSGRDASRGVGRRVSEAFEDKQKGVDDIADDVAVTDDEEIKQEAKIAQKEIKKAISSTSKTVTSKAQTIKEEVQDAMSSANKSMSQTLDDLKDQADPVKVKAQDRLEVILDKAKEVAGGVKEAINPGDSASSEIQQDRSPKGERAQQVNGAGKHKGDDTSELGLETSTEDKKQTAKPIVETVKDTVSSAADRIKIEDLKEKDNNNAFSERLSRSVHSLTSSFSDNRDETESEGVQSSTADEPLTTTNEQADQKADGKEVQVAAEQTQDKAAGRDEKGKDVRSEDTDKKSKAEASTGDAGDLTSRESASTGLPNEEGLKDSGLEGTSTRDISSQKAEIEEPGKQATTGKAEDTDNKDTEHRPRSRDMDDQQASWIQVEHEEKPTYAEVVTEGTDQEDARPARDERTASETLATARETTEDAAEPIEDQKEAAAPSNKASANTAEKEEENQLEHSTPAKIAENAASAAKHVAQSASQTASIASEAVEETLTGNGAQSLADDVSDKASAIQDVAEEESKGKDTQATSTETARAESREESPQWFERLTASVDSKREKGDSEQQGASESATEQDSTSKDTPATTDESTETESKKAQDKIIAESEPVRDEPKDTTTTAPSTPSKKKKKNKNKKKKAANAAKEEDGEEEHEEHEASEAEVGA